MKNTKKFLCVMSALIMAATVSGCSNEPDSSLFSVVSEEPAVSTVSNSEEPNVPTVNDDGELVPKINATKGTAPGRKEVFDTLAGAAVREDAVLNDIEAYADTATDGEMPYAEEDIAPLPDDDWYYGDETQVQPQAGLLTAGVWNDNDNWGFFANLVNNDKITIPEQYGLIPTYRLMVTVTDKKSNPIVNAKVNGFTETGELVWSAVTDKNGIAYLFNSDKILDLEIESEGKTVKDTLRTDSVQPYSDEQTVIKISDSKKGIIFDGESKNYDKTEIMFVVDTTGSMGDELMFLQSEFTAIAEEAGTQDTKFSINFYRDEYDEYTTKRYAFSDNIQEVNKKLNSEYAAGGGDLPEAVAEVLDETINDGGWSDESVKLMFLIFDAPPHDGKEQVLANAVQKAAEKGIRIIPVVSSNSDRDTELFGRCAAIMTGGTYIFLTDDSGIGNSHLEPIIGEYKVEKLYDIIVRTINEYKQSSTTVPEPLPVPEPSQEVQVSEIVDRTVTEDISTDAALEKFYEDDTNEYLFGSIKSEYVIVHYTDGTTETVVTALKNGKIALSDLDKYNIRYITEPKVKTLPGNIEIGTFSFEKEKEYSGKTEGFVNTNEIEMVDVIARARTEIQGETYSTTQVFYDETTDMWKVNFSNPDTAGGDVSVYLTGKGVTKLVVYGE